MALHQRKEFFNGGISVAFGAAIDNFAHLISVRDEGAVRGKCRVVECLEQVIATHRDA